MNKERLEMGMKWLINTALAIGVLAVCPGFGQSGRIVRLYEAESEFTIDVRSTLRSADLSVSGLDSSYADPLECFNTRQSDWCSEGVFTRILRIYRYKYPHSEVTDRELTSMLESAKLELVPHSRRVTIAIQSRSPELAAALANAYAEAIEVFTDEENNKRCDKAVAGIHQQVERQKRVDDELGDRLLKFRTANKIDNLEAERDVLNQRLQATTADVQEYEKRVGAAREWVNVLEAAKKRPENYGELPTDMPLSADIAMAYGKMQGVKAELAKLGGLTRKHPQVQAKEKELEAHTSEFNASVNRAYATAVADLASNTNQLNAFRRNSEDLKKRIDVIGQQIVKADAGLKQLEQEKKVSGEIYQALLQKENEQRIIAEQNNEIIRVGRPAQIPTKPLGLW